MVARLERRVTGRASHAFRAKYASRARARHASRARARHASPLLPILFVLIACGGSVGKPPAAPAGNIVHPVIYVPADLDLVLRLDVRRFNETMAPDPELSLLKLWESFGPNSTDTSESSQPLINLLKSADTLWLGCRLSARGCRDFVIVLRGRFEGLREKYGFGPDKNKRDLGGGWLSFDLEAAQRSSVARIYWRPPELAVLVSLAEVDSAERSLEQSQDATRLEPSENGLMSLVARSRGLALLLRERSTKAAEWLDQSERVEIRFDPAVNGTLATFTISFRDASLAKRSAQAIRILVTALAGFDSRVKAGDIDVQQLISDVIVRVSIRAAAATPAAR